MAIDQVFLEQSEVDTLSPTTSLVPQATKLAEQLVKSRNLEDLLEENNSLLRRVVLGLEILCEQDLTDPGDPDLEG